MNGLWRDLKKDAGTLGFAMAAVFFWGLLAHAYCFFDNNVSHDSLNEFHAGILGNNIKMSSGRIFVPLYRDLLRSDVTLPWLIGALSLIWIGLAVFLVIRIFRVRSKGLMFLMAGIFSVNISVSATAATYIHDLDCNMFAMLCAVGAVWLWRERTWGWIPGAALLTLSLGIYQSFLFTAISLVMMVCILWLLEGEAFGPVFRKGLRAVAMTLLAGITYFLLLKLSQRLAGITLHSGEYNSLDQMASLTPALLPELAAQAYRDFFYRLMNAYSTYPGILVKGITAVLLAVSVLALLAGLGSKGLGWKEKLLLAVLAGLLPLMMNMIYVLTLGESHDLMVYSIWLFWLLALLLSHWLCSCGKNRWRQWQKQICMTLTAVLLYGSVQFSNGMYMKKDIEHDAYLSMMTRIAARMESHEGYVPGETPVVFVAMPKMINPVTPGFKDYWNVTGMSSPDVILSPEQSRYQAYFNYVLGMPLVQPDPEQWNRIYFSELAQTMPGYPEEGFLQIYDGVLVVKMGRLLEY